MWFEQMCSGRVRQTSPVSARCMNFPLIFKKSGLVLTASVVAFCSSCSTPEQPTPAPSVANTAYWKGQGVPGARRIHIDLTRQQLRYYKGDQLVGVSPVATGREGHRTPTGNFRITQKDLHHKSSLYGDYVSADGVVVEPEVDVRKDRRPPGARFVGADMDYFMRVHGAVGMHAGYLPGYPASHGCIRLPRRMAEIFFHETPLGTPVKITGDASLAVRSLPPPMMVGAPPPVPYNPEFGPGAFPRTPAAVKPPPPKPSGPPVRRSIFEKKSKPKKQLPPARGATLYLQ